jgi:hypothetical protein
MSERRRSERTESTATSQRREEMSAVGWPTKEIDR